MASWSSWSSTGLPLEQAPPSALTRLWLGGPARLPLIPKRGWCLLGSKSLMYIEMPVSRAESRPPYPLAVLRAGEKRHPSNLSRRWEGNRRRLTGNRRRPGNRRQSERSLEAAPSAKNTNCGRPCGPPCLAPVHSITGRRAAAYPGASRCCSRSGLMGGARGHAMEGKRLFRSTWLLCQELLASGSRFPGTPTTTPTLSPLNTGRQWGPISRSATAHRADLEFVRLPDSGAALSLFSRDARDTHFGELRGTWDTRSSAHTFMSMRKEIHLRHASQVCPARDICPAPPGPMRKEYGAAGPAGCQGAEHQSLFVDIPHPTLH